MEGGAATGERLVTKVVARQLVEGPDGPGVESVRITFKKEGVIGKGSFGVVQLVRLQRVVPVVGPADQEGARPKAVRLAMKTVVARGRESRELSILRQLSHPNIVPLRFFFYSHAKTGQGTLLNLLFDVQPTTVHQVLGELDSRGQRWTREELAQYGVQLAEGLAYLHSLGIAHRDIKPRNLLVQPDTSGLQICDLGSACRPGDGAPLAAYICSRFYRAPELLLASTSYGTAVDLWSLGCVLAEMALLRPLVAGEDAGDQFAEVVELLGPPGEPEMAAMGVEDAVLAAAMGLVAAAERAGDRAGGGMGVCPRLEQLLGAAYPELPRLLEQLLRYPPDTRLPASRLVQEPFFRGRRRGEAASS